MGAVCTGGIRLLACLTLLVARVASAQTSSSSSNEMPIERCDVLPVVRVTVAGQDLRFLLDTGATTILNLKAFSAGTSKKIRVDSWQGGAATSAREVYLPDFKFGGHTLHGLKLPAIDLSPIGKACAARLMAFWVWICSTAWV
jgi:hypothetical protein